MSRVVLRAPMRVAAIAVLVLAGTAMWAAPACAAEESSLSFSIISSTPVDFPGEPAYSTCGDFDGDGAFDLALKGISGDIMPGQEWPTSVAVLRGTGTGDFSQVATLDSGTQNVGTGNCPIAAFDLDGDGDDELINASSQGVRTYSWTDDAGFSDETVTAAPPDARGVTAGDFDHAGALDLAVIHGASLTILLADGHGGFVEGVTWEGSGSAEGIAAPDLDGDGDADAVVALSLPDRVITFLNDGAGNLQPASTTGLGGSFIRTRVLPGDFDGDGSADVAVAEAYGFGYGPFSMPQWRWTILLGDDDGGLMLGPSRAIVGGGDAMAVADFDRDGLDDLATGGYFEMFMSVFRSAGAGTFAERMEPDTVRYPEVVEAADFDGDGRTDLFAVTHGYNANPPPYPWIPPKRWFLKNTTPSVDVTLQVLPGAVRGLWSWYTSQPSISLSAAGAASIQYAWGSDDTFTTYASPLEAAEGTSTLRYYLVDDEGSSHAMGSRVFLVDTRPPTGTMIIAGPFVSPTRVVEIDSAVEDTVSGVSRMRFDTGAGWGSWTPYSAVATVALAGDDGTQTVDAEYRDAAGHVMAASVDVYYLRRSTSIGLPSVTATVSYGTSVVVSATAREVSGTPLPGLAGVRLEISMDGGTSWPTSRPASYEPGSVSYEASTAPLRANSLCRFVFPGDDAYRASASAPQGIGVRAWLPRPVVPPRVGRGRQFAVYGLLKPRHGGHSALHLFRWVRGRWVRFAVVRAPHASFGQYSRYGAWCRVPYAGRWFVKAIHADESHALTTSAPRVFVAR